MQAWERERRERFAMAGDTLRSSIRVPTDTYITGDIPLLLTLLSKVPGVPVPEKGGKSG